MKNFLSIGNIPLKIDFNRKLNFCVGWNHDASSSNGVGKTTVFFTSILYALFGENRENVKQDSMINYYNRKDMYVKLELRFNNHEIEVYRSRKPNSFYYTIDGKKFQNNKIKITEKKLHEYLGVSEDIFKNIFIINASSIIEFIEESGSVRLREKFEKIFFRDVIFKRILETIRKELNNLNVNLTINKKSEHEKEEFLKKLKGLLVEIKNYGSFDEHITNCSKNIDNLHSKLEELDINDPNKQKKEEKLQEIYKAIDKLSVDINKNKSEMFVESKQKKIAEQNLKLINNSIGECPVCLNKLSESKKKELNKTYSNKIVTSEKFIQEYESDIEIFKSKSEKLKKFAQKFEKDIKQLEYDKIHNISEIEKDIQLEESNIEHFKEKKRNTGKIITQYKDIQSNLNEIIEENNKLTQDKIDLELINSIFNNQDGILVYFIKKVINNLNNIIYKFIKKMQFDFIFQFDEKLGLNFNINDDISIGNFSSGEQKAINFIIFFSLMEFFFKYIGLKSSIVIIDESKDTSLSENKINLVFEIFKEFHINNDIGIYFLSHDYSGIHNDVIEFDNVIHLEKKNNFTSLLKVDTK